MKTFLPLGAFLILTFVLTGCTLMVPKRYVPPPLSVRDSPDPVKVVAIPLPAIATNPNEGMTLGALNAFLVHDNHDEVTTVIAPQLYHNANFGTSATLYGAFYPDDERQWEFNLSKSERVNQDWEVKFSDRKMFDGRWEAEAFAGVFVDGSARFFGFQSDSKSLNESNYADDEKVVDLLVARHLGRGFRLAFGERFREVAIVQGAIKAIPFIRDKFDAREVPGIDGFTAHGQRVAIVFETLDSRTLPTSGFFGSLSAEINTKLLGAEANYRHYELEVKGYFSKGGAKRITVVRGVYNQTLGKDVPFLERSILGGENSLRGYGRNRFVDKSFLLVNIEERIRVHRWRIFNVNTDFEIAPFIDVGAVAKDVFSIRGRNFELNPGLGVRGVVRPNIVGRIDVGFGREGPAVFVGLGYPF